MQFSIPTVYDFFFFFSRLTWKDGVGSPVCAAVGRCRNSKVWSEHTVDPEDTLFQSPTDCVILAARQTCPIEAQLKAPSKENPVCRLGCRMPLSFWIWGVKHSWVKLAVLVGALDGLCHPARVPGRLGLRV